MHRLRKYVRREDCISITLWMVMVCVPLCVLLCAQSVRAQNVNSGVQGTVTDTSGAVVPGASVQLTNVQTGVARTTQSNSVGRYIFTSLIPGTYTLKVSKQGFTTYVHSDFQLRVAERASLDAVLKVGATTQTVTVSAQGLAALLTPSDNGLGSVISPQSVTQLPLNGRNFLQLGLLSGAAQPDSGRDFIQAQSGHPGNAITIVGNSDDSTMYLINGIQTVGTRMGQSALNIAVSDVDQFKVQYGFFLPDLGPSGGVVNVITKSGTNRFHGEAFDFVRTNSWEARDFFSPTPPGPYHRNQFGASLGGPIRKDKMFFFADYEGLRRNQNAFASSYHPDSKMFNGDFSEVPNPIYNPFSYDPTTQTRQAFTGNIIPPSMINSVTKNLLKYYPAGSSYADTPLNVFANPADTYDYNQFSGRVDTTINSRNTFYAQFTRDNAPVVDHSLNLYSGTSFPMNSKLAMAQWTFTPTPTLVNEFRLGWTRTSLFRVGEYLPGGLAKVGITGTVTAGGLTSIQFNGSPYGGFGNSYGPVGNVDNSYQIQDAVNWSHGNHQIGFGALLNYIRSINGSGDSNSRGLLHYEPFYTSQLTTGPQGSLIATAGTGDGFADFLLGLPTYGNSVGAPPIHDRWTEFQPYVQDTWKLRPSLTANLGLAWYLATAIRPQGGDTNFIHAIDLSNGHALFSALGQVDPAVYPTTYHNIAPRVGLAWQPGFSKHTVVRAGWGMYYLNLRNVDQAFSVLGAGATLTQTINNAQPTPTYVMGQNVFPQLTLAPITQQLAANLSGDMYALHTYYPTPYMSQWNLDIQHTFGQRYLLDIGYVGNEAIHLKMRYDADPCSSPGSLYCNVAAVPFPQYSEIRMASHSGTGSYHALVVKFERQWSNGLSVLANYTYSKSLSNSFAGVANAGTNQDPSCRACDRGMTYYNVPQSLVISSVWQLPMGRGKRFLSSTNAVANAIVSGWGIDAIATFRKGNPIIVLAPKVNIHILQARANRVCNGRTQLSNKDLRTNGFYWFDPSCFTVPTPFYFGTSGTGIITGPGINTWDAAVTRDVPIHESMHLQFRAEAFNAFNHASFGNPVASAGNSRDGLVTGTQVAARELQFAAKLIW